MFANRISPSGIVKTELFRAGHRLLAALFGRSLSREKTAGLAQPEIGIETTG